jgi:triosephosphate isomerase
MKKLIAGNWKMNGSLAGAASLARDVADAVKDGAQVLDRADILLCPPFLYVPAVKDVTGQSGLAIALGAQDCSAHEDGAFTGEISAPMLADSGCSHVILGHSERRQYHGESDELIAAKAIKAHEKGLVSIICVGELESEREAGEEKTVVGKQLEKAVPACATAGNTVIAYEPVWAIGTGKTATPDDVKEMHSFIREKLAEKLEDSGQVRILYGGSVKPGNAQELFMVPNVDGALIGGASLNADQFIAIARAA